MLARSEARLRGILDSAMDAIITIDGTQHIVIFNSAAEAMFGCPQEEAVGASLARFIPERFRGVHGDHVRAFGDAGTSSRRMGAQRIVTGLRRNGEEVPIDASISQVSERGSKFYTVILRDVTARAQAEQALRRSKEELQELGTAAHQAREQEKSRIARELHDDLAQALTALQMDVAWCKEKLPLPTGGDGFAKKLERMEALLDTTVTATRRIAADLRPLMLDDLGLVPAIEWLVENFTQRTGVRCELAVRHIRLEPTERAFDRGLSHRPGVAGQHRQACKGIPCRGGHRAKRLRDNCQRARRRPWVLSAGSTQAEFLRACGITRARVPPRRQSRFISAAGAGTNIEVRLPLPSQPMAQ
jgi:PAS domain S-box-containing protein